MTVRIEMNMPKSCLDCRFAYVAHTTFSGDILMCPYLGHGVSSKERDSSCPLQPVEEIKGTISTEDYMKFYKQAEELCNRNPGIKDFEDFNKALRENK